MMNQDGNAVEIDILNRLEQRHAERLRYNLLDA